jgi:DNA-binding Lrp family transcriptional regulator
MISTPTLVPILAEATGISTSTISNVARRLSEHGVLPRGSRGRAAPALDLHHVAQLLVTLMLFSDGYAANRDIASLPDRLDDLNRNRLKKELRVSADRDSHVVLVVKGSFTEEVAHLLSLCSDEDMSSVVSRNVAALGLTFGERGCVGWAQFPTSAKLKSGKGITVFRADKLAGVKRVLFSDLGEFDKGYFVGMIREVQIRTDVIIRLARTMADG